MFIPKSIYIFLALLLLIVQKVVAMPPYIAIDVKEYIAFSSGQACVEAAKQVLTEQGFEKILVNKEAPTVFAADEQENHYRYKATIKCLPQYELVIMVVVTEMPKSALAKLKILSSAIDQYTTNTPADDAATTLKTLKKAPQQDIIQYINQLSAQERQVLQEYLTHLEKMEAVLP